MTRLIWYFGMGALAHWLWIGSHVDPSDIFTYVCLLMGPIMCFVWLVTKAFWAGMAVILLLTVLAALWFMSDHIAAWNRRRLRIKRANNNGI